LRAWRSGAVGGGATGRAKRRLSGRCGKGEGRRTLIRGYLLALPLLPAHAAQRAGIDRLRNFRRARCASLCWWNRISLRELWAGNRARWEKCASHFPPAAARIHLLFTSSDRFTTPPREFRVVECRRCRG